MPDTPSITIVKAFTYRGVDEEWSNTYHFSGDTPDTPAKWKTLADAIWAEERKFLRGAVSIRKAYGYVAGNNSSVYQVDYRDPPNVVTAGLIGTGTQAPGDSAVTIRWATTKRNSKGRPVYLRKYFHGISITPPDAVESTTVTAMNAFALKIKDGTLPGSFRMVGEQGLDAGVPKVNTNVTTRTLKRRGRDPS